MRKVIRIIFSATALPVAGLRVGPWRVFPGPYDSCVLIVPADEDLLTAARAAGALAIGLLEDNSFVAVEAHLVAPHLPFENNLLHGSALRVGDLIRAAGQHDLLRPDCDGDRLARPHGLGRRYAQAPAAA